MIEALDLSAALTAPGPVQTPLPQAGQGAARARTGDGLGAGAGVLARAEREAGDGPGLRRLQAAARVNRPERPAMARTAPLTPSRDSPLPTSRTPSSSSRAARLRRSPGRARRGPGPAGTLRSRMTSNLPIEDRSASEVDPAPAHGLADARADRPHLVLVLEMLDQRCGSASRAAPRTGCRGRSGPSRAQRSDRSEAEGCRAERRAPGRRRRRRSWPGNRPPGRSSRPALQMRIGRLGLPAWTSAGQQARRATGRRPRGRGRRRSRSRVRASTTAQISRSSRWARRAAIIASIEIETLAARQGRAGSRPE